MSVAMNMVSPKTNKDVALIVGPTASGKSALALALAKKQASVVINADSAQVYRDLAILSARPSDVEMAGIPHGHFYLTMDSPAHRLATRESGQTGTAVGLRVLVNAQKRRIDTNIFNVDSVTKGDAVLTRILQGDPGLFGVKHHDISPTANVISGIRYVENFARGNPQSQNRRAVG